MHLLLYSVRHRSQCAVQQASFHIIRLGFEFCRRGSTSQGQLLNVVSDRSDADCVSIIQCLYYIGDRRVSDLWLEDRPESSPWNGFDNATPLHHAEGR